MQSRPLLFVFLLQNLPVDPGKLLNETPALVITPPPLQCFRNETLSDIERDCFPLHLGRQAEPGHRRGLGNRADEEGVQMSGDFLAEQNLSFLEKGEC